MARSWKLSMTVTMGEKADPEAVASDLFDFLASDPYDLFPQIETVDHYEYESAAPDE